MNQSYILTEKIIENYRLICQAEPDQIENWLQLGRSLLDNGHYAEAEQALTKIFDEGRFFSFKNGLPRVRFKTIFKWRKNKLAYAKAYADLAFISVNQANLAEAERLLTMAIKVFESAAEESEYFRALNRLGTVYRLAAAYESAEEMFLAARKIADKNQWVKGQAETAGHLGMVCEALDRFEEAIAYHTDALKIYEQLDSDFDIACQMRQIGLCCLRSGKSAKAQEYLKQALAKFEKTQDIILQSRVLNDLVLAQNGDKAIATALLAMDRAIQSEDEFEIADNSLLYARLRLEQDPNDAQIETLLIHSLNLFKKLRKQSEVANASSTLGLFYLRQHRWDEAESRFKDSLHVEQRLHRAFGIASDCCNLGLIAQNKGEIARAIEYFQRAAAIFEHNEAYENATDIKNRLAELQRRL